MKITGINIFAFGKIIDKTMNFSDGINVIYGNNEAGKTTTHAFIKAMLFGMKKKKSKLQTDIYTYYYPWNSKKSYGGTLTFTYNNKEYQITREFNEDNKLFEIREMSTNGKLINNPELFLNRVLYNLNSDSFDNTISIRQLKAAQDKSMVDELHRIISNLNTSGDMSIDTMAAIKSLSQKKDTLQLNIDSDATIVYNRQLGNIRNIERELSNKNYENKLPSILSKQATENKKIESNQIEIEKLKQENVEKTMSLENFGFAESSDIDTLLSEVNKVYLEYKPIMNNTKLKNRYILYFAEIVLGIIFIIISALFLVASYPYIAGALNISDTRYSMNGITNFLIRLPFHPIILISLCICLGIILIIGSIIFLINNQQEIKKSSELKSILSDVFNQHINDDNVNSENMVFFKKHMSNMRKIAKKIDKNEARIILLTKENNELLERQSELSDSIKSQQRIQFDVEQKYNELYNLKIENDKMKQTIDMNDRISKEIDSINLAIETIRSLSDEIQVAFGTYLNKSVSEYINVFTNGKYNSLNVDNALNITINHEGKTIPLSKVSTGTIDQTYLALRLAITDILNKDKEQLPLIFDDCFVMYDNDRLYATLDFLSNKMSSQILIFTCHTRESIILKNFNIKSNCINIE